MACPLCRGELTEILNLFPWGGVTLQFRRLRLLGVYDASTLGGCQHTSAREERL